MKADEVVHGALVRVQQLDSLDGMMVADHYITPRREGMVGTVIKLGAVRAAAVDRDDLIVVFVESGAVTAAYWNTELLLLAVPE